MVAGVVVPVLLDVFHIDPGGYHLSGGQGHPVGIDPVVVARAPVAVLDAVGYDGKGVVAEDVVHALDPEHLRPRLAADVAVGYGVLLHVPLVGPRQEKLRQLHRPQAHPEGQQQAQPDIKPQACITHKKSPS